MLSFFRRLINSKVGIIVTFAILAVIALAFAAGDITGLGKGSASADDTVATVGGTKIASNELRTRAQSEMESYRQQQPTLDMVQFVSGGGIEGTLDRLINGTALSKFGTQQGMIVSKRLVDGQLASIPGLQGPDGKFSQTVYERLLSDRHMTDAQIRGDIIDTTMAQHIMLPTSGATQVPALLALPYASLLLEKRDGLVGFIPTRLLGTGAPPTDPEVQTFYAHNKARYTVAERRVIRYALVDAARVKAAATPSDAEIAQAYAAQKAKFAPSEKRGIAQVVIADQAAAAALAAKVKAGTSIAEAARAAGLEPLETTVDKAGYAAQTSPAIADAVFAAAKGAVVGPIRSPLGWIVVHVDTIQQIAGKSLEQARPEIVAALSADKAAKTLAAIHDKLDDSISDKATFDELIADQKLTPQVTPPVTGDGSNPDNAAAKPDPTLSQVVAAAFSAEQGDSPQLVPVGAEGSFAVVALDRIVPAAPRPLAQIRDVVARDFAVDRARLAARKLAGQVTEKVNKGMPLAQAMASTGLPVPPVKPLSASRAQIAANPRGVPAPLALLFSMAEHKAKLLDYPEQGGWLVIYLDKIERGDATGKPNVIAATRADLGKAIGGEYAQQFSEAVRRVVGVKKNDASIAAVKAALTGQGAPGQP